MLPRLITIGDSFYIPTYGVLVATAFLIGLWLAGRLGRRVGLDPEKVANLAIYCTLSGFLGAKLMMFLFDWERYAADPGSIFTLETLQAAGVFHGGFLLALLVAVLYMRRNKMPVLTTMDVFSAPLAIAHAIGRLGCFAAGCCWGNVCERPWAVTFRNPEANEVTGVPLGVPLHPTQLYEAIAGTLIFVWLLRVFHRPHREGAVFGQYLVLYSVMRFAVEFLRHHDQPNPFDGPFSTIQWITIGLALLGIWLLRRRTPVVAPGPVPAKA
jgi:phosphatidylglycerol:prolipoprotein diacylglycerol transferase